MLPSQTTQRTLLMFRKTLLSVLGGTLVGCASPTLLGTSHFGFIGPTAKLAELDVAWAAVANNATHTYGELAMVNFAMRQINFAVQYTDGDTGFDGRMLKIPRNLCIANNPVLVLFAALAGNVLGRNELDAADKASAQLQYLCAPGVHDTQSEGP
jgi:hypothetical protein